MKWNTLLDVICVCVRVWYTHLKHMCRGAHRCIYYLQTKTNLCWMRCI
jgi:hypothetical protein